MKVAIAIVGLLALLQAVTAPTPLPDKVFQEAEKALIKRIAGLVAIPISHNYEVNLAWIYILFHHTDHLNI